jgi:thiamine pyrophosphokinase
MDEWQKAPEPSWYMGGDGFPWDQLMGQFLNPTNGSPNHIDNMEGGQGAFLFALPEVAVFQDYNTISGTNAALSHRFNARFETGKSYALTVALLGGGGGMSNGATFQISLYYRDMASNMVTVAATTITNTQTLFPTNTHFIDFQVRTLFVQASDAWAGKHIGIRLASTVGFDLQGGYWDVDNVRLTQSVVPNGSFESPETDFADPRMDAWQKASEPAWYMGGGGFPWDQLMGQFLNTTNGSPNHIDNVDGEQAAFLFALPEVAIFQDYNSISGTNTTPSHDFNVKFEAGKSYALTVGVVGGGGGMSNGVTFEIRLYYRDAASNRVTVAATSITNTPALFPTNTHLTDFQVIVPTVKGSDAWADKNIGIQLASTVGFDLRGGYWDVDNVRLVESIIPNGSFESPETSFADPRLDGWQKAPEPARYMGGGGFPWDQLMGQFLNTTNGSPSHIDNMDGKQAAFLFALPQVAIFQDYNTMFGTNAAPTHDFNTKFEVGKSYNLTVGVLGSGGGMSNGATFQISMYYRDAATNMVTVAATTITNTRTLFPTNTHFTDFNVQVPTVTAIDAWAGKQIGIQLASTVGFDLQGGYWDVDDVRLRVVRDPILAEFGITNTQFQFTLQSAPGRFEILASTNIALPPSSWTSLGTITNFTGSISFMDTNTTVGGRFYQARQSP